MTSRARTTLVVGVVLVVLAGAVAAVAVFRSGSQAPEAGPMSSPSASAAPSMSAASSAVGFGAVGTTERVPCPEFLTSGAAFTGAGTEVEGETYTCGVVVVPENYDRPDGRTIELFYLKLHSSRPSPASDPLVYLAGGPGSSGSYELTANPGLYQSMQPIRQERDVIAYDQRGSGFSNHLLCAPYESALGVLQERADDPEISQTIQELQAQDSGIGYGALRTNLCAVGAQLLGDVDLSQYTSVRSANDIAALVEALGYSDGYNLYGTSYGTRLAQYAMREDPEGVRSVILDGVSGPQIPNGMWSQTKSVSPYVEIFAMCQADAACAEAYPNLAERFDALLDRLQKDPLVFDPPLKVWAPLTAALPTELTQIDADFFLGLARINNIAQGGGFVSLVPRMITAAEERDVDYFRTSRLAETGDDAPPVEPVPPTGGQDRPPLVAADQPLFEAPFVTLLTLAQNAASTGDSSADSRWLAIVLGDLASRLEAGENQADLIEVLLNLSALPHIGTTTQQLVDFASANLSTDAAVKANDVVTTMTRNDVRATMWSIQDVAMNLSATPDARSYSDAMYVAVNCSDELAFTSLDVAKDNLSQTAYPQLAAFPMSFNKQVLLSCLAVPTTLDASVTDPVVSDIPTLLFLGRLDNETPVAWGRNVAKELANSTVVEWDNLGHVAAALDLKFCAAGIAADFLDDPASTPDLTCTESSDYDIAWVLE